MLGAAGGAALVGGLLTLGILPRMKQEKKLEALSATTQDTAVSVNVALPHYAKSGSQTVLPGSVQAVEEAVINARAGGYLRRRYVDIGSRVKAGQVLAEIEAPEVDEQLVQARAETAKSQAGGEQAQADVARLQANVAQAQANVVQLQSNLEAARADLAHTRAKLTEAQGAFSQAQAQLAQTRKNWTRGVPTWRGRNRAMPWPTDMETLAGTGEGRRGFGAGTG